MRALGMVLALCVSLGGCASLEPAPPGASNVAPLAKDGEIRIPPVSDELRWRERYAYMYGYGPFGRACTSFRSGWWAGGPPWSMCY